MSQVKFYFCFGLNQERMKTVDGLKGDKTFNNCQNPVFGG